MVIKARWSDRKLAQLSYRLSYLLESGIPLLDSIDLVMRHFAGREKEQLQMVRKNLEQGQSLSKAICHLSVPPLFVSLIVAGEQHGHYASSFSFAERYYHVRARWKHQIYQLVSYPALLFLLSLASLWFLFSFIFPQISAMYRTLNVSLPLVTRIMVYMYAICSSYGWPIASLIFLLVCFFFIVRNQAGIVSRLTRLLFAMPVTNTWMKLRYSHYFSMQAGLLLESGISILEVGELFYEKAPWPVFRQIMSQMVDKLQEGRPLSKILAGFTLYFTAEMVKYIELGEEGGQVGQCLFFYAGQAEEEIKQMVQRMTRWLEPLILLLIGMIVLVVVLSFFLPVLHMVSSLK